MKTNYYENAKKADESFFGLCLFNPQLDIYSFQKHYREDYPVLTAPLSLYDYHLNGFPYMTVFKDGNLLYSDSIWPYEEKFYTLREKFWKDKSVSLCPTSPLHMAIRFIWENDSQLSVVVCPDEDETLFKKVQERYKEWKSVTVKYESELTEEDYMKNLVFGRITKHYNFKLFEDKEIPIKITSESIQFGTYLFPKSDTGLNACFPNPFNRERYIVLELRGINLKSKTFENWVDYTIYKDGTDGKAEILLHGFFEKNNEDWKFSESLAFGSKTSKQFCKSGVCPAPAIKKVKSETHKRHKLLQPRYETTPNGELWILGSSECRFPNIIVDQDRICWAVWEEDGDIILSSVNKSDDQKVIYIEDDSSDSFNPLLAMDQDSLWIFYLNNQDRFYRLYGKQFDGHNLSNKVLISEKGPFDVVTPDVTFNRNGKMVIAWTEWKANYRFIKYRTVEDRILGEVQEVQIKSSDIDYTCAWYPSLALDDSGRLWASWNQHYPITLCVCAGDLIHEAKMITEDMGGYPSIVLGQHGKQWVFWESFMWDVLEEKPQRISASYYDSEKQQWSLPYILSMKDQTLFNQTPKAAVDKDGVIWVVWSGREDDSSPWNIYISHFEDNKWSTPEMVSSKSENARAPDIFIDKDGKIWITWHSGIGSEMKVKVLRFQR